MWACNKDVIIRGGYCPRACVVNFARQCARTPKSGAHDGCLKIMKKIERGLRTGALLLLCLGCTGVALGQGTRAVQDNEFGPVVRAYLGYLRNEQEVVDDRVSRHEVNRAYYLRNSNRIRALRQMAVRIARESGNDYLPELEAATRDELNSLFETPPRPETLRVGEVLNSTFRFLGVVRSHEIFYIFARLDPYEQAELLQKEKAGTATGDKASGSSAPATMIPVSNEASSRARRANAP